MIPPLRPRGLERLARKVRLNDSYVTYFISYILFRSHGVRADGEHERTDIYERCCAYPSETLSELPPPGRGSSLFYADL